MNKATKTTVSTLGIVLALSGMSHGLFEIMQGNTPTGGRMIAAIGEGQRMWVHGSEWAFTLLPTFLLSGIASIAVSLAIIIWSLEFIDTRHGATVYLLLFVALFLVGGGIGQVVFFTLGWAAATRIHKPLMWWRQTLSPEARAPLAKLWPGSLVAGSLILLAALWIAVFGYVPGISDADRVLTFMLSALGMSLSLLLLTFVAGFAYDIEQQPLSRERVPIEDWTDRQR